MWWQDLPLWPGDLSQLHWNQRNHDDGDDHEDYDYYDQDHSDDDNDQAINYDVDISTST